MDEKGSEKTRKPFGDMTADELMQTDPMNYHGDANCESIISTMIQNRSGAVTIVDDEKKPIGIVTEYDLLRALHQGKDLTRLPSREIMTEPIVIGEKTLVSEVLDTLVTGHIIHLPVVDYQEKLIGLIERKDILSAFFGARGQSGSGFRE